MMIKVTKETPLIVAEDKCHDPYLRCAFYGAAQTVMGVSGSCTLAHSPQGCYLLAERAFEWQNEDYTKLKFYAPNFVKMRSFLVEKTS